MAFVFRGAYEPRIKEQLVGFYRSLSEKDRRRFAAMEAMRWGFGGGVYVAQVFGCSERTIERGRIELQQLPQDPAAGRIRRPGAGRKKSPQIRNSSRI